MKRIGFYSLFTAAVLFLGGCGDDSSSASSATTSSNSINSPSSGSGGSTDVGVSGVGQNKYLDGSTICLDVNENDQCDSGEKSTILNKGNYSLTLTEGELDIPLLIAFKNGDTYYEYDGDANGTVNFDGVIRGLSVNQYKTLGLGVDSLVTNQFGEDIKYQMEMYDFNLTSSYDSYRDDVGFDPKEDYQKAIHDGDVEYEIAQTMSEIIRGIKASYLTPQLTASLDTDEEREAVNDLISDTINSLRGSIKESAENNSTDLADLSDFVQPNVTNTAAFIANAIAQIKAKKEIAQALKEDLGGMDKQAMAEQIRSQLINESMREKIAAQAETLVGDPSKIEDFVRQEFNIDDMKQNVALDTYKNEIGKEIKEAFEYENSDAATQDAIEDLVDMVFQELQPDIVTAIEADTTYDVAAGLKSVDLSQARLEKIMSDNATNNASNFTAFGIFGSGSDLNTSLWMESDSNGSYDLNNSGKELMLSTTGDGSSSLKETIAPIKFKGPAVSVKTTISDINVTAKELNASVGLYIVPAVIGGGSENYSYSAGVRFSGNDDHNRSYRCEALYIVEDKSGKKYPKSEVLFETNTLSGSYTVSIFADNMGIVQYDVTYAGGERYLTEINSTSISGIDGIKVVGIENFELSTQAIKNTGNARATFSKVRANYENPRLKAINSALDASNASIKDRSCGGESCLEEKYIAMSASPFSFYRGSAGLYYQDIAYNQIEIPTSWSSNTGLVSWIQGDAHMENLGYYNEDSSYSNALQFMLNDFDESYKAPFYWDVLRFATSIRLMVDYMNGAYNDDYNSSKDDLGDHFKPINSDQTELLVKTFLNKYIYYIGQVSGDSAVTDGVLNSFDPESSFLDPDVVSAKDGDAFMKKRFEHAKDRRIDTGGVYMVPDTYDTVAQGSDYESKSPVAKYTLAFAATPEGEFDLSNEDLEDINGSTTSAITSMWNSKIVSDFAGRDANLSGEGNFTVKDIVRVLHKGTGSLGLDRFYVLTEGLTDSQKDDLIFQIKEEDRPSYLRYFPDINATYSATNPASIVVEGFKMLSNQTDNYLSAQTLEGRNYLVQSELDADYSLDPDNYGDKKYYVDSNSDSMGSAVDDLNNYVDYAAKAYAYAHARSTSGFVTKANNFIVSYGQFDEEITSLSAIYFDQVKIDWQLFNNFILPTVE